jgi:HlyD family secretion protein
MRQLPKYLLAGIAVLIVVLLWFSRKQMPAQAEQGAVPGSLVLLASPGRVEGQRETISLGAAADGVIKAVFVTEGQRVTAGTVLAEIDCGDLEAEIDQARAEAESARQSRIRLLRGHRDEEREAAAQNTAAAQSVLNQSQEHYERMDNLYKTDSVARDLLEQTKRDYEVAQANYQMYRAEQDLVDADPLPEEKSKADSDVAAAEKNVNATMEKLRKCAVRAPFSGTVLKSMARVGEAYSTLLPRPLFSFTNDSGRRVKAEIDEWDVGKVKLGERAIVSADGFPGRQFDGRVIEMAHTMGRKSVLSGDPAEKADRDVLEVTIELDQTAKELPVGLRVTAQFLDAVDKTETSNPPLDSKLPEQADGVKQAHEQSGSDQDFYHSAVVETKEAHLRSSNQAAAQANSAAALHAGVSSQQMAKTPPTFSAPLIPNGAVVVQVAAVESRSGALALAQALQLKKFPAFVITPGADKYYHVQVGPYADAQLAASARHELEAQGFKSIIKR